MCRGVGEHRDAPFAGMDDRRDRLVLEKVLVAGVLGTKHLQGFFVFDKPSSDHGAGSRQFLEQAALF